MEDPLPEESRGGARITTPVVSVSVFGWLGLATVGVGMFFAIQLAGVYAVWQLGQAQLAANAQSATALDIVRQQARDWQSVLSQISLEHRDMADALKRLGEGDRRRR